VNRERVCSHHEEARARLDERSEKVCEVIVHDAASLGGCMRVILTGVSCRA
jgi:hypothetical protein